MRNAVIILAVLALITGLAVPQAQAMSYTWSYTGPDFTSATDPYTKSDFISGEFTADYPSINSLPFNDYTADVQPFSFSDGVQTLTDMNVPSGGADFRFSTDAGGNILAWQIDFLQASGNQISTGGNGFFSDIGKFGEALGQYVGDTSTGDWTVIPAPLPLALVRQQSGGARTSCLAPPTQCGTVAAAAFLISHVSSGNLAFALTQSGFQEPLRALTRKARTCRRDRSGGFGVH